MQFGLFYEAPEDPRHTHAERFAEMLDLIVYGESLGFDVAWLAEIHFGAPSHCSRHRSWWCRPSPRAHSASALARPSLPLHHPLSLAEHVATADLLSGGRLEFGVGRGSIPTQFHGFGVPVAENRARFEETLEIMRLAWTTERFSYTGKFYRVDNLAVVPKPLQHPHPPIRVGGTRLKACPPRGARLADLFWYHHDPLPQLREGWRCTAAICKPVAMPGVMTRWP